MPENPQPVLGDKDLVRAFEDDEDVSELEQDDDEDFDVDTHLGGHSIFFSSDEDKDPCPSFMAGGDEETPCVNCLTGGGFTKRSHPCVFDKEHKACFWTKFGLQDVERFITEPRHCPERLTQGHLLEPEVTSSQQVGGAPQFDHDDADHYG
eukprot:gnl/Hemi2/21449_TR7141_c0_g7_i1.p3 gnl/Hemi2/21449_TR7141_c0_g7~~gnl/Hemi2/21449_TR7141_c0_g7_i1.p3  ORF type:complete len:151 (-),score=60.92 gnl/Hemi2/21449_TR7141_c0_g7_i1:190-642(-)